MNEYSKIFLDKKILVYGLGKSGLSSFNFLKATNDVYLFDDNLELRFNRSIKKKILSFKKLSKFQFDLVILSPGIDINNCKLKLLLKRYNQHIYTDLDIFYSFYKNNCITITGTNGKSTTCKLLYDILKDQKIDTKLAGNIGIPILSIKRISKKTIFIIEASSYQLEYSKIFTSKYAAILNISPDHLERHGNLNKYISAKFKLLKNQKRGSIGFINRNDRFIQNKIKKISYKFKLKNIDTKIKKSLQKKIDNEYFSSKTNQANLSFALEIIKNFPIKKNILLKSINKFSGLNYRQQIIFQNKKLMIINDSKSTSYSSSEELLKMHNNIYWLVGGIPKKKDKLNLSKNNLKDIQVYIFGKNYQKFYNDLKNKAKLQKFKNLKKALDSIIIDINKNNRKKNIILFSPASASFDIFKNFEDRGLYFNKLIQKYVNERKIF
ncbi:MAG: UDP-N-acetylmuramoyl-L-alanine--D-glutamate ligase [Candidatus Pelagibacter sp.]